MFWFTLPVAILSGERMIDAGAFSSYEVQSGPEPSDALVTRLTDAATVGDVDALLRLADEGRSTDPDAAGFYDRVSALAAEFRIRAVSHLLDRIGAD